MRTMKFKKSFNQTVADNEQAIRNLCVAAGKPIPEEFAAKPVAPEFVKAPRKPSVPSDIPLEHEEQKDFVKWFRSQYRGVLIYAIPNAGLRDYKLAAYLRAEGLYAGMPDLHIPAWDLWIEMKRQKNSTISEDQRKLEQYLVGIGHKHFYAFGCDDAIVKVKDFLSENGCYK